VSRYSLIIALAAFAALAGCGSSPPAHFYTLSAPAGPESAAGGADASYTVAVGPVTLPEVADRPQLVLRVAANEVAIAEQHRWAEPLKGEIARAIARNLAHLLGTARVATNTENAGRDADYRVLVDVQRFDSVLGEAAAIEALWSIRRGTGGEPVAGRFFVREPAGPGYDALVAAHGRALAALSRDLAKAIRSMPAVPR
jgi:uncharacterized protein